MTGVGTLLRLHLRRDRLMLLLWTVGITYLYYAQAVSVRELYSTQAQLDAAAAAMSQNPAFVAMAGPARALDTVGGQVTWQSTAFGAVCVGLMSMFLVGRHTRGEEELGRDELVRSAPVDRTATTTAAVLVVLLANLLVGAVTAAGLVQLDLATADSLALGAGLAAQGLVFGGVALLAAQVTSSTRATYGWTGAAIGAAYLLRAIGDVTAPALSWTSPIGWYQAMHAFSGLRWWPLLPALAAAAVLLAASYVVLGRRDHGAGLRPDRAGPAAAASRLGTPLGLAWRLQRGPLLGWAAGLFVMGLAYGSMGDSVDVLIGDSQTMEEVIVPRGTALLEGFYGFLLLTLALISAGFAVSSALRPRHEEAAHRVELLSSAPVPRWRLLAGHAVVTVLGTVVVMLAASGGLGLAFGLITGRWRLAGDLAVAGAVYLPPLLVLAALAWLLHSVSPRLASLAWAGLGLAAVVTFFGELLDLPGWVRGLSPFDHVPLLPAQPLAWAPVLVLTALAVSGTVLAHLRFATRDLG